MKLSPKVFPHTMNIMLHQITRPIKTEKNVNEWNYTFLYPPFWFINTVK